MSYYSIRRRISYRRVAVKKYRKALLLHVCHTYTHTQTLTHTTAYKRFVIIVNQTSSTGAHSAAATVRDRVVMFVHRSFDINNIIQCGHTYDSATTGSRAETTAPRPRYNIITISLYRYT